MGKSSQRRLISQLSRKPISYSQLSRQKLQGDSPLESEILGLVDNAHPAPADFTEDGVLIRKNIPLAQDLEGGLGGHRLGEHHFRGRRELRAALRAELGLIRIFRITAGTFCGQRFLPVRSLDLLTQECQLTTSAES